MLPVVVLAGCALLLPGVRAQACTVADLGTSALHTQGMGYNVFGASEPERLCYSLGVQSATPAEVLAAEFGETCASVRSSPEDLNACPAIADQVSCDTSFFNTAWFYCLPPKACRDGDPAKGWLVTLPADFCFVFGVPFLEVTFADGTAPLSGCQSSADAASLTASLGTLGVLGSVADSCRPVWTNAGLAQDSLDWIVAQTFDGQRCASVAHTAPDAIDACPAFTDRSCIDRVPDSEFWVCDRPDECGGADPDVAWVVVADISADCVANSNSTIFEVSLAPQPRALRDLKRIHRPYVDFGEEAGVMLTQFYVGQVGEIDYSGDRFSVGTDKNIVTHINVPEGLALHAYIDDDFDVWDWDPMPLVAGPYSGAIPTEWVAEGINSLIVQLLPGYYVEVWRDDFEAKADSFIALSSLANPAETALEDANRLHVTNDLAFADTIATCADLRRVTDPFMPEFPHSMPFYAFDIPKYQTPLSGSPYTESDAAISPNNVMSSFITSIGYRVTLHFNQNFGGRGDVVDSIACGRMHAESLAFNEYGSITLEDSPWCDRPPTGACGIVASTDNLGVGSLVHDEACLPPGSCTGSDLGGIYSGFACRRVLNSVEGSSLAEATEDALDRACANVGDVLAAPTWSQADAPRDASTRSPGCANFTLDDLTTYDDYFCERPSSPEAVTTSRSHLHWVRVAAGTCDFVSHASVLWDASAPCIADCEDIKLEVETVNTAPRKSGSFVHWGQSTCPDGANLVYAGYGAGSHADDTGGSARAICLSDSPELDYWSAVAQHPLSNPEDVQDQSLLYKLEYDLPSSRTTIPALLAVDGYEVPCAVCEVTQRTTWTVHGSDQCPGGHDALYAGFVTSSWWQDKRGDYLCLSQTPAGIGADTADGGARATYPVEGRLSVAPGYTDNREITCAVCATPLDVIGDVFVNYGASACSSNTTALVEGGRMATTHSFLPGGGSAYLCLTPTPSYTLSNTVSDGVGIFRVEFETQSLGIPGFEDLHDSEAACSVCLADLRTSSIMVPGTTHCPAGFVSEYQGWLMAQESDLSLTSYVCVDANAAAVGSPLNEGGGLLYPVETVDFAGATYGYRDNAEVPCAQCSLAPDNPSLGPVYVRWGRTTCPATADKIYDGILMAALDGGSGRDALCLPPADYGNVAVTVDGGATLHQAEYHLADTTGINAYLHELEIPCTVCQAVRSHQSDGLRAPSGSVTVYGSQTCPANHRLEYFGRLFSQHASNTDAKTDFICMDSRPEPARGAIPGHQTSVYMHEVEVRDSLASEYVDNAEVTCAQCTRLSESLCQAADIAPLYNGRECRFVATVTGDSLWATTDAVLDSGCLERGPVSTSPDECPASITDASAVPCTDARDVGALALDEYICEQPTACGQDLVEQVWVRVDTGTCNFHSHHLVAWNASVPATGLRPPSCSGAELGGVFAQSSCSIIGRSTTEEPLSDFVERQGGFPCVTESTPTPVDECPQPLRGVDTPCADASTGSGEHDYYRCTIPDDSVCLAANYPASGRLLVRTDPGTCNVDRVTHLFSGVDAELHRTQCSGTDFGGVLADSTCEFAGQFLSGTAEQLHTSCFSIGPDSAFVDQCPRDSFTGVTELCADVEISFPFANYLCSYPTDVCGAMGVSNELVWVQTHPLSCDVVSVRELVPSGAETKSFWAAIDTAAGNAESLEIELVGVNSVLLDTVTLEASMSPNEPFQVAAFSSANDAVDVVRIRASLEASGSTEWTPNTLALFEGPGFKTAVQLEAGGVECRDAFVASDLGSATGVVAARQFVSLESPVSFETMHSTCGAGDLTQGGPKAVYLWQPATSGVLSLNATALEGTIDPVLAVYDLGGCSQLACSDAFASAAGEALVELTVTVEQYLIVVASSVELSNGFFTLSADLAEFDQSLFPGDCESAIVDENLASQVGTPVTTGSLVVDAPQSFPGSFSGVGCIETPSNHQRVFLWRAPAAGTLTVSAPRSNFEVVLVVFEASSCTALACNDFFSGGSLINQAVSSGEWYFVVIMGVDGASGQYELDLAFVASRRAGTVAARAAAPVTATAAHGHRRTGESLLGYCPNWAGNPVADHAAGGGVDELTPFLSSVDTTGAEVSATISCAPSSRAGQRFVLFTAPFSATFEFSLHGSSYDTVIGIFDLASCAELACNDDAVGLQSRARAEVGFGKTVIVAIGGAEESEGSALLTYSATFKDVPLFLNPSGASVPLGGAAVEFSRSLGASANLILELDASSTALSAGDDTIVAELVLPDLSTFSVALNGDSLFIPAGGAWSFFTVLPRSLNLDDVFAVRLTRPDGVGNQGWAISKLSVDPSGSGAPEYQFVQLGGAVPFGTDLTVTLIKTGPSPVPAVVEVGLPLPVAGGAGEAFLLFNMDDASMVAPVSGITDESTSLLLQTALPVAGQETLVVTLVAETPLSSGVQLETVIVRGASDLQQAFSFPSGTVLTANQDSATATTFTIAITGADALGTLVARSGAGVSPMEAAGTDGPALLYTVPSRMYPIGALGRLFGINFPGTEFSVAQPGRPEETFVRIGNAPADRLLATPKLFIRVAVEFVLGGDAITDASTLSLRLLGAPGSNDDSSFAPIPTVDLSQPRSTVETQIKVDHLPAVVWGVEMLNPDAFDRVNVAQITLLGRQYVPHTPNCAGFGGLLSDILGHRMVFVPRDDAVDETFVLRIKPFEYGVADPLGMYVGFGPTPGAAALSHLVTSKGLNPACADASGSVPVALHAPIDNAFPPAHFSVQTTGADALLDIELVDAFGFEWIYREPVFGALPVSEADGTVLLPAVAGNQTLAVASLRKRGTPSTVFAAVVGATPLSTVATVMGIPHESGAAAIDCSNAIARIAARGNPSCDATESINLVKYLASDASAAGSWIGTFNLTVHTPESEVLFEAFDVGTCGVTEVVGL